MDRDDAWKWLMAHYPGNTIDTDPEWTEFMIGQLEAIDISLEEAMPLNIFQLTEPKERE